MVENVIRTSNFELVDEAEVVAYMVYFVVDEVYVKVSFRAFPCR